MTARGRESGACMRRLRKSTGRSSALQVLPDAGCSSIATLYMSGSNVREMRIIPCRCRIFMGHAERLVATLPIWIDRQIMPVRDLRPTGVWRTLNAGKIDVGKDQRWRKCCRVRVRIVTDSIEASEQVLEIAGDIHFAHWPADLSILNHVTAKPK